MGTEEKEEIAVRSGDRCAEDRYHFCVIHETGNQKVDYLAGELVNDLEDRGLTGYRMGRDGAYGEPLVDLASHSNSLIWIVTPAILKKQWIWKSAYAILFNIHKRSSTKLIVVTSFLEDMEMMMTTVDCPLSTLPHRLAVHTSDANWMNTIYSVIEEDMTESEKKIVAQKSSSNQVSKSSSTKDHNDYWIVYTHGLCEDGLMEVTRLHELLKDDSYIGGHGALSVSMPGHTVQAPVPCSSEEGPSLPVDDPLSSAQRPSFQTVPEGDGPSSSVEDPVLPLPLTPLPLGQSLQVHTGDDTSLPSECPSSSLEALPVIATSLPTVEPSPPIESPGDMVDEGPFMSMVYPTLDTLSSIGLHRKAEGTSSRFDSPLLPDNKDGQSREGSILSVEGSSLSTIDSLVPEAETPLTKDCPSVSSVEESPVTSLPIEDSPLSVIDPSFPVKDTSLLLESPALPAIQNTALPAIGPFSSVQNPDGGYVADESSVNSAAVDCDVVIWYIRSLDNIKDNVELVKTIQTSTLGKGRAGCVLTLFSDVPATDVSLGMRLLGDLSVHTHFFTMDINWESWIKSIIEQQIQVEECFEEEKDESDEDSSSEEDESTESITSEKSDDACKKDDMISEEKLDETPPFGPSVSQKELSRPLYDFHIIYDDQPQTEDNNAHGLVQLITQSLEQQGYRGTHKLREAATGMTEMDESCRELIQADYVICLLSKNTDVQEWSHLLTHHVNLAWNIKLGQGGTNKILPVFYQMSETEVRESLANSSLAIISMVQPLIVTPGDNSWLDKLKMALLNAPSSRQLFVEYGIRLPDWCCPLFRLEDKLFIDKSLIDLYLLPSFTVAYTSSKRGSNDTAFVHATCIEDTIDTSPVGSRIIISAPAGAGKSALSSHYTRGWCKRQFGHRYHLVYLLPPRYIHSHSEPVERIICHDLRLHDTTAEGELRRTMKLRSHQVLFIIDGYDEIAPRDRETSSLRLLLSGEVAPQATVVVTTRPQFVDELQNLIDGPCTLISVYGLTPDSVEEYIETVSASAGAKLTSRKKISKEIRRTVPHEVLHVPLLLNMTCLIWQWNKRNPDMADDLPSTRTVTEVIARVIGMYIGIQAEKEGTSKSVPVFCSPLHDNVPQRTVRQFLEFSRMCFACISRGEFIFSSETLTEFGFGDPVELWQLGFLDVTTDTDGSLQSARCIHNQLMEYCAGAHVARHQPARRQLLNMLSDPKGIETSLGFWNNVLIFAVGIDSQVLDDISHINFYLPVSSSNENSDLGLAFETRLFNEASDVIVKEKFLVSLVKAPLSPPHRLKQTPEMSASAYEAFVNQLGPERCMDLLKRIHRNNLSVEGERGRLRPQGSGNFRKVTDMVILVCLPRLTLSNTDSVSLEHLNLDLLPLQKHKTKNKVTDLKLMDCTLSSDSLARLVSALCRTKHLLNLTLAKCQIQAATEEPSFVVSVGRLSLFSDVKISVLGELTRFFHVHTLDIGRTNGLRADSPTQTTLENVSILNMPKSENTLAILGHMTAPCVEELNLEDCKAQTWLSQQQLESVFPNADFVL